MHIHYFAFSKIYTKNSCVIAFLFEMLLEYERKAICMLSVIAGELEIPQVRIYIYVYIFKIVRKVIILSGKVKRMPCYLHACLY